MKTKVFVFKCKDSNGNYVEKRIAAKNIDKAEKVLMKEENLIPIEYLGWEEL